MIGFTLERHVVSSSVREARRVARVAPVHRLSGDGFWDRLRPELRASFLTTSPIERWAVLFSNPTTLDDVRLVQVQTLVLCGENTTAPERRMCELVAGATPHAELGVLPAAGHMSPITHPKEVAHRIARHISMHLGAS